MKRKAYQDYMDRIRLDEDQQAKLLQALKEAEEAQPETVPEKEDKKSGGRILKFVKYGSLVAGAAMMALVLLLQGYHMGRTKATADTSLNLSPSNMAENAWMDDKAANNAYSGGVSAPEAVIEGEKKSPEVSAQLTESPGAYQPSSAGEGRKGAEELIICYKDQEFRIPLADLDEEALARLKIFLNELGLSLVE